MIETSQKKKRATEREREREREQSERERVIERERERQHAVGTQKVRERIQHGDMKNNTCSTKGGVVHSQ